MRGKTRVLGIHKWADVLVEQRVKTSFLHVGYEEYLNWAAGLEGGIFILPEFIEMKRAGTGMKLLWKQLILVWLKSIQANTH